MSEQAVHQAIAVFLNRALPEGAWHTALDSAGKASIGVAQRLKARGGKRGVPDHLVMCAGFPAIFFEVKTEKGRLSPEQQATADLILRNGGAWSCVRCIEDVELALRCMGIPLRATVGEIRSRIEQQREGLKPVRKRTSKPRAARASAADIKRAHKLGLWKP